MQSLKCNLQNFTANKKQNTEISTVEKY